MCWTPHATVATIVEQDGRFLLVEEVCGDQRVINQPAGHVEENETIRAAAVRETLEETRWHVEPQYLVGLYTYRAPANGVTYYRFCFAARALSHDAGATLDSDILRPLWLSRDELAARQEQLRSPLVLRCIDDYLAGRRFPLDFVVEHSETQSTPL
ncbi:NUDIX hydrolase [Marinobacterium nitratireducens]|uniref:Phosphatase NudJ n=1 Tax=Marinobacterium nitratireducens TaxID=518897 RepID=A0A917Z7Z5_9GAMM|nr:NUDIX hydrolase [Marinobacterium nitratireducens]GGO76936.1 NUDIX hydrolase [Marinobacterium nitratireducens]